MCGGSLLDTVVGQGSIDLLFAVKEAFMSRGHFSCSDHRITALSNFGEVRKGISRTSSLNFQRADLSLFRDLVWLESLGRQIWKVKESRKAGILQEWNLKGTVKGCPNVPWVNLVGGGGRKTSLHEHRASSRAQEKKVFMNSGRRGRQLKWMIKPLWNCAGKKN